MEQAIIRAMEGGWKDGLRFKTQYPEIVKGSGDILIWYVDSTNHEWTFDRITWQVVTLDPLFWQCLGKAEGWAKREDRTFEAEMECWQARMGSIIDHIITGKSIDDFFNQLLK